MTIEVSILLSAISVSAALVFGIINIRRNSNKDCAEQASQSTKIITKLDGIEKGVSDIKEELKNVKDDVKNDHDRIIRLEEAYKLSQTQIERIMNGLAAPN